MRLFAIILAHQLQRSNLDGHLWGNGFSRNPTAGNSNGTSYGYCHSYLAIASNTETPNLLWTKGAQIDEMCILRTGDSLEACHLDVSIGRVAKHGNSRLARFHKPGRSDHPWIARNEASPPSCVRKMPRPSRSVGAPKDLDLCHGPKRKSPSNPKPW